jgi:hypothetical protein
LVKVALKGQAEWGLGGSRVIGLLGFVALVCVWCIFAVVVEATYIRDFSGLAGIAG